MSSIQRIAGKEVGLIDGREPGSKEEWRLAAAYTTLRYDWDYQVPVHGGSSVRGGQIVDFVTHNPFDQPVQVYGVRWHSGGFGMEDRLKLAILQAIFGMPAIIYWDYELTDESTAVATVRSKQG